MVTKSLVEIMKDYRVEGTVPADLKEEVFKTISTIELTADILDLFTVQFVRSKAALVEQFNVIQKESDMQEGSPDKQE